MKTLVLLGCLLSLVAGPPASAQTTNTQKHRPFPDRAFSLLVGGIDHYAGPERLYPAAALRYDQVVSRPLTVGLEIEYVGARGSHVCILAADACPEFSDPLWYATLDLQLHPSAGRIRPYFGASAGVLTTCDGHWCRTLGLEGGLRVPVADRAGLELDGRWRVDHRNGYLSTQSKEARLGVYVVVNPRG